MSHQDVLKAELKARRSSRELEHGLESLGVKVMESTARVNLLKIHAGEIVAKVTHPRETTLNYLHKRGRALASTVRRNPRFDAGVAFLRGLPPIVRPVLLGLSASMVVIGVFLTLRKPKKRVKSGLPFDADELICSEAA